MRAVRQALAAGLFGLLSPCASEAAHPPQKPHPVKISSEQASKPQACVRCHKGVQGKFTHSAIEATGCVGCHDIRAEGDKTLIALVSQGRALCLSCHADKDAAEGKGRVHAPVGEGDCTTCHSPHASGNRFQLLQPTSGGKAENLCLLCHDTGVEVAPKGSKHTALELGCDTCHVTHKGKPSGNREFANHLSKPVPTLCLDCHDAGDKQIAEAHAGQPIGRSDCVACHNPHASARPKLMHSFSHPPFAEKQCDACHEAPKQDKVALVEGGKQALCYLCHDAIQKRVDSSKHVHGALVQSETCTVCHSPHTSPYPQHLHQPPVALCESCHTQRAQERATKKFIHPPVFQVGCTACHEPHAASFPRNLRAQINDVCLSCHAQDAQGGAGSDAGTVVLFDGAVRLPERYLAQVKRLPLRRGATVGHPLAKHPVGGVANPANPTEQLSCVSCHNPHAGNGSVQLFVTETRSSSPLCIRCHK